MSSRREGGFTLLEIMIAVAVLVVGILGVLAIFPVALRSGKMTIEETNCTLIALSVEQAIRESISHRKGQTPDGKWNFFVFNHQGVQDPLPRQIKDARPDTDYFILLPETDTSRKTSLSRVDARDRSPVFVYPETDGAEWLDADGNQWNDETSSARMNGGGKGDPTRADDDADDMELPSYFDEETEEEVFPTSYMVMNTYRLSADFFHRYGEEDAEINPFNTYDPLQDYSFAFSIRRSYYDASQGRDAPSSKKLIPASELFEVDIMVYRSFRPGTSDAETPLHRTTIFVHK